MTFIDSPSPGADLSTWKAWQSKLKTMPSASREVRQEQARAEKMIQMLSKPVEPLGIEKLKELFSGS